MEPIQTTIERVVKNWQGQEAQREKEDALRKSLKNALTKQEQKHIKHYSLRNTQVILNVDSSVWFYLLRLKKRQLSRNLNQALKLKEGTVEIFLRLDIKSRHKR